MLCVPSLNGNVQLKNLANFPLVCGVRGRMYTTYTNMGSLFDWLFYMRGQSSPYSNIDVALKFYMYN